MAVTGQNSCMFTPSLRTSLSQASSTASRLPASNVRGLRSGRICGSAITCLPFWYFWMVLESRASASMSTCVTPSSAACAAAESPAGPEPMIPIW
jgi:hypothetical protein